MSGAGESRRVVLDLEPTPDGIRGAAATEDGTALSFDGWLELSALLDKVRPRSGGRAAPPRPASDKR